MDLDAKCWVLLHFMQFDLNLATGLLEINKTTVQVERHRYPFLHTAPPTLYVNGKKSPTGYFGPGIIIFLCNEAVLLSSEKHFVPWRLSQTGLYRYSHFRGHRGDGWDGNEGRTLKLPVISSLKNESMKISF